MKHTFAHAAVFSLFLVSMAHAVETTSVELRNGEIADGLVTITRSDAGGLVFTDLQTSPTTLLQLTQLHTAHGELTGLSEDDHPQYLNEDRHEAVHTASVNGALPITADVGGNTTLGAHVADATIHPDTTTAENISGRWVFAAGLTASSDRIALGLADSGADPAITFADSPSPGMIQYRPSSDRFDVNRTVRLATGEVTSSLSGLSSGVPTATISGFASVEGIASADLLSSTANESISGSWAFLSPTSMNRVVLAGTPCVAVRARNVGAPIAAGRAARIVGYADLEITIEEYDGSDFSNEAFLGIVRTAVDTDALVDVVTHGLVETAVSGSISPGDPVAWDASAAEAATPAFGIAVTAPSGGKSLVWIR